MNWLIYGTSGYTGELVARLAVARGERPILAGRTADRVGTLPAELGLEHRVFRLDDPDGLRAGLDGVDVVAHCAGPFSATARPMLEACVARRTHYVDITGEIDVFEQIFGRDADARAAGVVLLPGAGFDVVPTDCLAAMLSRALPSATELDLAFYTRGGMSPGTAKTSLQGAASGGRIRVDGRLTRVPLGWRRRAVPFPSGSQDAVSIPWGDVSTAYRSTGIPTITTYIRRRPRTRSERVRGVLVGALARLPGAVQGGVVDRSVAGPDAATRARTRSEVWGEVRDGSGRAVSGTLTCPNAYDLTADSVVRIVQAVGAGVVEPGAHTPSTALGPDFVRELDGVAVGDLNRTG